jgi:hypothetical protein
LPPASITPRTVVERRAVRARQSASLTDWFDVVPQPS